MHATSINPQRINQQVSLLHIENAWATACISLWGGQVLSFRPRHDQRERLYLSKTAALDGSTSIRGGIPICWPWFGPHKHGSYPVHGYLSRRPWLLQESEDSPQHSRLLLEPVDTAGPGFTGSARVTLEITVGKTLTLTLGMQNIGSSALTCTLAMHNYFSVDDVRQVRINGLTGHYLDNLQDLQKQTTPQPYQLSQATDRIHLHAAPLVSLVEGMQATLLQATGHDSVVVWNPWHSGSGELSDMGKDDWRAMLCVEAAVTQPIELLAGQTHCLQQTLS